MTSTTLTKSYVNTHDPHHPVQEDLVIYELFEKAKEDGFVGELVNMETKERMTTTEVLKKVCEPIHTKAVSTKLFFKLPFY